MFLALDRLIHTVLNSLCNENEHFISFISRVMYYSHQKVMTNRHSQHFSLTLINEQQNVRLFAKSMHFLDNAPNSTDFLSGKVIDMTKVRNASFTQYNTAKTMSLNFFHQYSSVIWLKRFNLPIIIASCVLRVIHEQC